MRRIPIDAQYDEPARPAGYDAFHFERIPERRLPGDSPLAPQRHDALLQVLYVRGGTGQVAFDGIRHALATPCLVLLPARTPTRLNFLPASMRSRSGSPSTRWRPWWKSPRRRSPPACDARR